MDPISHQIELSWTAPNSRSDEITQYRVEAQKSDLQWLEVCDGFEVVQSTKCIIEMSLLLDEATYNKVFDELV